MGCTTQSPGERSSIRAVAVDQVVPGGRWEFDGAVADSFEDMLQRSIPQHDVMRRAVVDVGERFARPGTTVVDLGCSRGEALATFHERLGGTVSYLGVEVSDPMLEAARRRFEGTHVRVEKLDLRTAYPTPTASVTLAVLTLQFVPIEHRLRILRDAWRHTSPGGCLVVVEKVLGETADLDALMVDLYYGRKREAGYTQEDIDRKRLSLEGVLVPVTYKWNVEMLRSAGFTEVDCFWRWMNFCGLVAVRT